MSMNVSTTTAAYANYQNNYKTGTANKKKETAQTTENTKLKENTTESIAEKNLSKAAQKMLENLRGSRNDMDFMVADFENGDNAKDILAQVIRSIRLFSQRKKWRRWRLIRNIMQKKCIALRELCACQMKSMPSSDLKEHSVRLTAMQMLIQK